MNPPVYSSLTAFLAHREVLRRMARPSDDDRRLLEWMESRIGELDPPDREALEQSANSPRHRQRAERELMRRLREQGAVAG